MKKIGVCGHFSFGNQPIGGQTIKTHIITDELKNRFGNDEVICVDTNNWKKNKFKLLIACVKLAINCKNIVILPAHNGVNIFIPLFVFLTKLFNKKLHYIVVGAWLVDKLNQNKILLKITKKINYIYVQSNTLAKKLKEIEINKNVYLMPNFKSISSLDSEDLNLMDNKTYKLCIMSRITESKGIEDAVQVVSKINNNYGSLKLKLDIYGPLEQKYEKQFNKILKENQVFLTYKGSVDYNKTSSILKNYYLLLFPTKSYTEGFPGTIMDSFLSGLPTLAARWESCYDIIEEGVTGITYNFNDQEDFYEKLNFLINNQELVNKMKYNCLQESKKYTPEHAMVCLLKNLKENV